MAYLNDAERKQISDAVGAAELTTSGEIVTVLADRSDGYTDVALWWALAASFTAMSLFAALPTPFLDLYDALIGGCAQIVEDAVTLVPNRCAARKMPRQTTAAQAARLNTVVVPSRSKMSA